MIPRLYDRIEYFNTSTTPTWSLIGTLRDALSCVETSAINGEWELVMEYPINGLHASDIQMMRLINTTQFFFVYRISKNASTHTMTVYARHISYLLSLVPALPLKTSFAYYPSNFFNHLKWVRTPFSFSSEISDSKYIDMIDGNVPPSSVRDYMLNDQYGAVAIYGGEWEFNNLSCNLKVRKGTTRNITIRYGVDLIDAKQEESIENVITHIVPYAYLSDPISIRVKLTDLKFQQQTTRMSNYTLYSVYYTEPVRYETLTATPHLYVLSGPDGGDEEGSTTLDDYRVGSGATFALPGASSLPFKHVAAVNVLDGSVDYSISQIIKMRWSKTRVAAGNINIVLGEVYDSGSDTRSNQTWTNYEDQAEPTGWTLNYSNLRAVAHDYINAHPVTFPVDITVRSLPEFMSDVKLGDTITVYFPDYGINTQAEIMTMEYDVLKDRIESYTLGKGRTSFAETMLRQDNKIERLDGLVTAKNPNKGL